MTDCEIVVRDISHDGRLSCMAECDPHHWVVVRTTSGEIYDQVARHKMVVRDRDEELREAGLPPQ